MVVGLDGFCGLNRHNVLVAEETRAETPEFPRVVVVVRWCAIAAIVAWAVEFTAADQLNIHIHTLTIFAICSELWNAFVLFE